MNDLNENIDSLYKDSGLKSRRVDTSAKNPNIYYDSVFGKLRVWAINFLRTSSYEGFIWIYPAIVASIIAWVIFFKILQLEIYNIYSIFIFAIILVIALALLLIIFESMSGLLVRNIKIANYQSHKNISRQEATEIVDEEEKFRIDSRMRSELLMNFFTVLIHFKRARRFYIINLVIFIAGTLIVCFFIYKISLTQNNNPSSAAQNKNITPLSQEAIAPLLAQNKNLPLVVQNNDNLPTEKDNIPAFFYKDITYENKTVGQIITEGFFTNIRFFIYESILITLLGYCLKKISSYISIIEIYKELEIYSIMDIQRQGMSSDINERNIISDDFKNKFYIVLEKHYSSFIGNKNEIDLKTLISSINNLAKNVKESSK